MGRLKCNNVVVHSNDFSTIIEKKMTMVEQRMIAIYISKLNPYDITTRTVSFKLLDYERMMGLQRFNITQLQDCARKIINTPVMINTTNGGFLAVNIFSYFWLDKVDDEWVVKIDCNDMVLPFLFDLKKEFVKYELWNILNLTERNHQQMFRLLKQYEGIGHTVIELSQLKICLGIEDKYSKYNDFKRKVLDSCKKSLNQNTDICFEYEPIRKGRSIHSIKFMIHKNTTVKSKILLSDFVSSMSSSESNIEYSKNPAITLQPFEMNHTTLEQQTIDTEFSKEQLVVLVDCVRINNCHLSPEKQYDYLVSKYNEMCMRNPQKSRFGYIKKMIEADSEDHFKELKTSYDIEALDKFWDKIPTLD